VAALANGDSQRELELSARTRKQPSELAAAVRDGNGTTEIVLFIDQLEELVTLSDPEESAIFCEVLFHLSQETSNVRVLATLRGDFIGRVAALPGLGSEVARALYLLRPLTRDGIRDAIVGPARAKGVSFESEELVDNLVESTARAD